MRHRRYWVLPSVLFLVLGLLTVLAGAQLLLGAWQIESDAGIGPGAPLVWLVILAFWAATIAGLLSLVRWLNRATTVGMHLAERSALDILRRNYATGQIDRATFERLRRELGDGSSGRPRP